MITVVGEALVDLVIGPDGSVEATLGGAPFNTARVCGRLGADVRFVGAVGHDRFGTMLADRLIADRVDTSGLERVDLPTTLAAAELDDDGAATYRFYIAGTAAPMVEVIDSDSLGDVVFAGGLGLVMEPMASAVEAVLAASRRERFVMIDVNCRPRIVPDGAAYAARLDRVVEHADVVKVSDEDLEFMRPDLEPVAAARTLLDTGPSAVLLTRGAAGVEVLTSEASSLVEAEPVGVVDTIGAGDSFGGGFLSWWVASALSGRDGGDIDQLVSAARAGNQVAAVVVSRRGADPPWRNELAPDWSP